MGNERGAGAHGQVRVEKSLSSSAFVCSGIEDTHELQRLW
jgi:hypothetical protein